MTIHFLTDSSFPHGTYFRSHNLAQGLTRLGHRVRVFACDHDTRSVNREELRDSVEYRITRSSKAQRFFGAANNPFNSIRRAIQDYDQPDIVHLFQPFISQVLAWCRQARSSRIAAWYDWDDLWDGGLLDNSPGTTFRSRWDHYWTAMLEKKLASNAPNVTACSTWLANLAQSRGATSPAIIRNGFWPAPAVSKSTARRALGLDADAIYLGFMGRTRIGSELEWCIEGLAQAYHISRRLRLTTCGVPKNDMPKANSSIQHLIEPLGVLDAAQAHLFSYAIDVGLVPLEDHPFNWSRFPIRFAHFLGANTPVLVSQIGDVSRFSNLPGVIPAGPGKAAWLQAFQRAAAQTSSAEAPRVDAKLAESLFSWDLLAAELQQAYSARPMSGTTRTS